MIRHQAISASAGSGKTFQLAHRYIRLMALGVPPDRIIALTFSRKAAAEIFDSIVEYLKKASESEDEAAKTAARIGQPQFVQTDFLRLLRQLLDQLHRLHIGTLDSFAVGILKAFPIELGIPPGFQITESGSSSDEMARQEVLQRIFNHHYVNRETQQKFLNAFKQATFGLEEKGLERNLASFIEKYRDYYQTLPSPDAWGNPETIWPEGSPWLGQATCDIDSAADQLLEILSGDKLTDTEMERWQTFLDAAREFDSRSPWSKEIEFLFEKITANLPGLIEGNATLSLGRRSFDLSPQASELARQIITHIIKTELESCMEKTRGIYSVLDQYQHFYNRMMRLQGRLTFGDIQSLLSSTGNLEYANQLTRIAGEDSRIYIDYRLDCKLDHWLLDEFQDTSTLQWGIFCNLIDEVLQDGSGQRSFFYVGDVKQAIYGWRGGNARLFDQILNQYPGQIEQLPMNTSFRSAQPIIDTMNRVFCRLPAEIPQNVARQWEQIWQDHQCGQDVVPDSGYAALLEPDCRGGEIKPTEEDRFRIVAKLINEVDPATRNLSAGILVRKNDTAQKLSDFLRAQCENQIIVNEGKGSIDDNPVTALLLSLIKFAAHPGDTLAQYHIRMSPLKNLETDPADLLAQIQSKGFQWFVRHWGNRLDQSHPLDEFGQKRLGDVIDAAGQFDASGSRDTNEFLRFTESYRIRDEAATGAVRVMTIHQSKGLGFDMVILPDLEGRSITKARDLDMAIGSDPETGDPIWALKLPRRLIAEKDPSLAEQVNRADQTACFDALCLEYVALTRAKQALYMITSFPGKSATALNPGALLRMQLGSEEKVVWDERVSPLQTLCSYEAGDRNWHLKIPKPDQPPQETPPPELTADFARQSSRRKTFRRIAPSAQTIHRQKAADLFDPHFKEKLEFGTAVHQLFARFKWSSLTNINEVIESWQEQSSVNEALKQKASEAFRTALQQEEISKALTLPKENISELWQERTFEIILGDRWVTGAFDRVVIERDDQGKAQKATLIDFKTDSVENDGELDRLTRQYIPQLKLYSEALSKMLEIDPGEIESRLIFTSAGKVVDL